MAELGMQLAEAAARKALRDQARAATDRAAKPGKDMAATFARIAGTIHQAIKLEAKLTAPPPQAARQRPAAPKVTSGRPVERPMPRTVENYPEPPATEWPFLKQYAQPCPAETSPPEPTEAKPAPQAPPQPAPAAATLPPHAPAPTQPAWTPPPPHHRATDPPRLTGPNWTRLFER
jgi:hypothetical protein